MADEVDIANDYITQAISSALGKRQQNHTGVPLGSKFCTDCGEEIPVARQRLGFRLCIECAEESERRKALFADY